MKFANRWNLQLGETCKWMKSTSRWYLQVSGKRWVKKGRWKKMGEIGVWKYVGENMWVKSNGWIWMGVPLQCVYRNACKSNCVYRNACQSNWWDWKLVVDVFNFLSVDVSHFCSPTKRWKLMSMVKGNHGGKWRVG